MSLTASEIVSAQAIIWPVLAAALTFVAVSGFLTEKKNGALELLLVTPVSPGQIIFGRVWGLWKQFLPAGLSVLLIWQFAESLVSMSSQFWQPWRNQNSGLIWGLLTSPLRGINWTNHEFNYYNPWMAYRPSDTAVQMIVAVTGFLALPIFATYFALRVKNLIVAAVLAWLALFLCPYFAFTALGSISCLFNGRLSSDSLYVGVFVSNLAFALLACFLLRHSLSRRIYSF
jgi:hypothetical protein